MLLDGYPAREIKVAPKAVDSGEARPTKKMLVERGGKGNKNAFEGFSFLSNCVLAIIVVALDGIILAREDGVDG